jgi:hypothetical protein
LFNTLPQISVSASPTVAAALEFKYHSKLASQESGHTDSEVLGCFPSYGK